MWGEQANISEYAQQQGGVHAAFNGRDLSAAAPRSRERKAIMDIIIN